MRLSIPTAVVMATLLVQLATSAEPPQANAKAAASKQQDEFTLKVLCTKQPYESVEDLRKDLQTLDLALPNIPPDEAAYLAKEESSVLSSGGDKASAEDQQISANRMAALENRRLYYAWKARKALADALISEQSIYDPDHAPAVDPWTGQPTGGIGPGMWTHSIGKEDADQIYRMIAAITSLHVAAYDVQKFLLHEQARASVGQKSLLTAKQWNDSDIAAYGTLYHLSAALGCAYMQYGMKHR